LVGDLQGLRLSARWLFGRPLVLAGIAAAIRMLDEFRQGACGHKPTAVNSF